MNVHTHKKCQSEADETNQVTLTKPSSLSSYSLSPPHLVPLLFCRLLSVPLFFFLPSHTLSSGYDRNSQAVCWLVSPAIAVVKDHDTSEHW